MNACGTPLDPRLDAEVVELNKQVTWIIPDFCMGAGEEIDDEGFPVDYSKRWLVYLAAEIHGNADAAFITLSHNRGRQARILERQVYECMKKAEYYVAHPDEARLEFLAWPFREKAFCCQLQRDENSDYYQSVEACITKVSEKFPDVPPYCMKHKKERNFSDVVGDTLEYALYYRRLSQTPHISVLGMWDVLDCSAEEMINVRFDSRMENPDKSLHTTTGCLISFLRLFERAFALGRDEEVKAFDKRHGLVMERLYVL